jgi:hypothetical protein
VFWIVLAVLLVPVVLLAFARRWGQWFPSLGRRADAVDAKLANAVPVLGRFRDEKEREADAQG